MAQKTLSVKLSLNDKQFQSALRKSTRSIQRFSKKMQNFGQTMTRNITLPVIGLGAAAVKMASDFEETRDKFNIVFRDISEAANSSAKELAKSFNMSNNEAMRLLANTGDLLAGFGFTQEEALNLATEINKLAADLSSFDGATFSATEASKTLTKALLGERDALVGIGIKIAEEDLKKYAKQKGLNVKELDRITKAQLTFELALKQSANAIGNVEKTSGSFANQLVRLQKDFEDLAVELGVEILPLAKDLVGLLRDLAKFTSQFSSEQRTAALQTAGFAAVLGPIISVVGSIIKAFAFLRKFFFLKLIPVFKLVASVLMNLSPQGRIISGLIVAASYLVTNWGKVKKGFDDLVKSTKDLLTQLGLLEKKEDLALDFSQQEGEVLTIGELRRRAAGRQGVKIVPEKQISPEEEERKRQMAIDKLAASQLKFAESIKITSKALKEIKNDFATLEPIVEEFEESVSGIDLAVQEMNSIFGQFGSSIQGAFVTALQSTDGFFVSLIDGIKRAVNEMLSLLLVTAIFNALLGGTGMGALMGLKGIGGFRGIGDVFGRSVVGETPDFLGAVGARSMINTGGSTEVFGVISGADILLSSDRAKNNRNRTRGY